MIDLSNLQKKELIKELTLLLNKDNSLVKEIEVHQNSIQEINENIEKEGKRIVKETYSDEFKDSIKKDNRVKCICFSLILGFILFMFIGDSICSSYETAEFIAIILFFIALFSGITLIFFHNQNEKECKNSIKSFKANILPGLLAKNQYAISQKQIVSDLEYKIFILERKRVELRQEYNIARQYYYHEYTLYTYLMDNRADNLKEAIEVFELEKHRLEVKQIQIMQYEQINDLRQEVADKIDKQTEEIANQNAEISSLSRQIKIKNYFS